MKFEVKSRVNIMGMKSTHEHVQEFRDDSNVFGRALEYRQYMRQTFPGCEFELISAKEVRE